MLHGARIAAGDDFHRLPRELGLELEHLPVAERLLLPAVDIMLPDDRGQRSTASTEGERCPYLTSARCSRHCVSQSRA